MWCVGSGRLGYWSYWSTGLIRSITTSRPYGTTRTSRCLVIVTTHAFHSTIIYSFNIIRWPSRTSMVIAITNDNKGVGGATMSCWSLIWLWPVSATVHTRVWDVYKNHKKCKESHTRTHRGCQSASNLVMRFTLLLIKLDSPYWFNLQLNSWKHPRSPLPSFFKITRSWSNCFN